MITGFVTLIGTLLGLVFWGLKRHAAKTDDPKFQQKKRYDQIANDIVAGDSDAATVHASDDLDELQRLQDAHRAHSGGPA